MSLHAREAVEQYLFVGAEVAVRWVRVAFGEVGKPLSNHLIAHDRERVSQRPITCGIRVGSPVLLNAADVFLGVQGFHRFGPLQHAHGATDVQGWGGVGSELTATDARRLLLDSSPREPAISTSPVTP